MKLFAPAYYKQFRCIADKCKHSCCVGWKIEIDDKTYNKYTLLNGGYGECIKSSIKKGKNPCFNLLKEDRCPHLDERNLCKIITNFGEDYLCSICNEHPRFYNDTARGKEVGVGIACEEACRIILTSDCYYDVEEIGDGEYGYIPDYDALKEREEIYSVLKSDLTYSQKIHKITEEFSLLNLFENQRKCLKTILKLNYLKRSNKCRFSVFTAKCETPKEYEKYAERFFAYLIYRYVVQSEGKNEVRKAVGLSLFLEKLLVSILMGERVSEESKVFEIARIISEEIEYNEGNIAKIKSSIK